MQHIGQDWRRKHLAHVLENNTLKEKVIRDAWLNWTTQSAMLCRGPLAQNMPHTQAFQRKVATWRYNQFGLETREMWQVPKVDHLNANRGVEGTREWVPWMNVHSWTMHGLLREGKVMAYRVSHRGYGTDKYLNKGKWRHRYHKVHERDSVQYTRS
jgi:hypothetical protein